MLIKHQTRWYVDPIMQYSALGVALGYGLYQTVSKIAIAYFPDLEEATWVAHKLNAGRKLSVAMGNLLSVDDWLEGHPNGLVDDALQALTEFNSDPHN